MSFNDGYAFVVGIANYPHLPPPLPESVLNDAADLVTVLRNPERCGYPPRQVRHLSDEKATAAAIIEGLEWLIRSTSSESTALFFFSGHGLRKEGKDEPRNFLVAHDAQLDADAERPIGLVDGERLSDLLRDIPAGRLVVVFDCCHAAGAGRFKSIPKLSLKSGFDPSYYDRLRTGKGRAILASSRAEEESLALPEMRNSLFSHYLLKAMRGDAASSNGEIRIFDAFNYVAAKVPEHDERQHPVFKAEVENNFAIGLSPERSQERSESPESSKEKTDRMIKAKNYFENANISTFNA